MNGISTRLGGLAFFAAIAVTGIARGAADAPSVKLALSFRPVQKDVEYETPSEDEFAKCKVQVERTEKTSGWIVVGPNGQTLRRFVDTNGDNVVDQWRYFLHGLEVYRDIDSNFNNKVDQCRWLNTGGTRWGIDKNEDGKVDSWKQISAGEASREAVRALVTGDERRLLPLLITADDTRALGIPEPLAKKMLAAVADPGGQLKKVREAAQSLTADTRWLRFDGATLGVIPAEDGKSSRDLKVYENAVAIVETNKKPGIVQIGEMIQVGEVWKLTQIPTLIEGNGDQITTGGVLMQPAVASVTPSGSPVAGTIDPAVAKLLEKLQKLDQAAPAPTDLRALAQYNADRADILAEVVEKTTAADERAQWMKQMVDGIAAAVQTGTYPAGLARLKSMESTISKSTADSLLLAYTVYRRLLAEYTVELQRANTNEKRQDVQKWWLKELEEFASKYPNSEDAGDAILQLAITHEFSGKFDEAKKWYAKAAGKGKQSGASIRAAGALRRLDLKGKPLELVGPGLSGGMVDLADYRGKAVLVLFWSTWCKPCTEDLPQIKALYKEYRGQGFEIIGVNLDLTSEPVQPYLKQYQMTWPQIHQAGGLDSGPAKAFGIISLPTMILVDQQGKVVSRSVTVADLKGTLPDLLKK